MQNIIEKFGAYWDITGEGEIVFEAYDSENDLLGIVFQHPMNLFRIHVFHKVDRKPQWIGLWWSPVDSGTICSTEDEARQILNKIIKHRRPAG